MAVVIARSRTKAAWATVGCAAFVAGSVALVATGSPIAVVTGAVGALTFSAFGVIWAALGFRRGPGVLVDEHGFDDRSSALAVGRVPWGDVVSVRSVVVEGVAIVVVGVREPEAYVARVPRWGRAAARANTVLVGSPVTLSSVGLRTTPEDLLTTLVEAHDDHVRRTP